MMTITQRKPTLTELLPISQELLPRQVLEELVKASGKTFYERLFSPMVILWGLIYQRLNADHTCDAALSYLSSGSVDHLDRTQQRPLSARIKSTSTAAYCKARKRLPLSVLQGALGHTGDVIRSGLDEGGKWRGHSVGLLDGSTLYLSPEPELVAHYGRHQNGQGQTYWVVMRVVVAFCLRTAALLGVAEGPLSSSEQGLAKTVLAQAQPNSLYLGDSNFGIFSVAQAARHYGVGLLLRLTQQRAQALANRHLRSGEEIQVCWSPSKADKLDPDMAALPLPGRLIYIRLERDGFRPVDLYLFTTLLDAQRYPLEALVELYGWRWHVELDLRYVKSTLDMDHLTAKTVDMIRKELFAGLVAYNLIRGYMAQAAHHAHLSPLTLSFSRCWRRVAEMLHTLRSTDPSQKIVQVTTRLFDQLARTKLPQRKPFRIEPRAIRGQPKVYPYFKGSRQEARQKVVQQRLQPKTRAKPVQNLLELPQLLLQLPAACQQQPL